jgi:proteasome accessory factor A
LIEEDACPEQFQLQDPVRDLKRISRSPDSRWTVTLENGSPLPAIELQMAYQREAEKRFFGMDPDTDWVISEWGRTLEALSVDPYRLVGKIDWISKKWLMELFLDSEGLDWNDPWIVSLDLEYHNLNPEKGLSFALEKEHGAARRSTDSAIGLAAESPPRDTRAYARGEIVRSLLSDTGRRLRKPPGRYLVNWTHIQVEGKKNFTMDDPFKTYYREVHDYLADR